MEAYVVIGGTLLAGIALMLLAGMARRALAPRATNEFGDTTYESGVDPVGSNWAQLPVRYLAFAFLYVVFAVDVVFLFPWALIIRDPGIAESSLIEIAIFIGIVFLGLVFVARRGLLKWTRP